MAEAVGAPRDMTGGGEIVIYFWDCVSGIKKDSMYGKAFASLLLEYTSAWTDWVEPENTASNCILR